jgi:hypothetical protein
MVGREPFHNSLSRPCHKCQETAHYYRATRCVKGFTHPSIDEFRAFPVPAGAIFYAANVRYFLALSYAQHALFSFHQLPYSPDREVLFQETKPAVCAVYFMETSLDEDELGPSFDNTELTGGPERNQHKADFMQIIIRANNVTQNKRKEKGFPVLADAVQATVRQALEEIEARDTCAQTFAKRTADNFRRINADPRWKDQVRTRVKAHCYEDRVKKRDNDLTEAGYVRCLEKQGARCPVSLILFGEREWTPSMDRIDDLLGHIIADPSNVKFIIRMFNTQIKMHRKLFLQVLLRQRVQQLTQKQRGLILAELDALTEP